MRADCLVRVKKDMANSVDYGTRQAKVTILASCSGPKHQTGWHDPAKIHPISPPSDVTQRGIVRRIHSESGTEPSTLRCEIPCRLSDISTTMGFNQDEHETAEFP